MAGRDFAKVEAPSRQNAKATKRASSGSNSTLVGVLTILGIGFFAGFLLGKENAAGKRVAPPDDPEKAALQETVKQQEVELKILQAQVDKLSQKDDKADKLGDLTFYSELPKQSVVPAPLTEPDDKQIQAKMQPKAVSPETRAVPARAEPKPASAPVASAVAASGEYRVQTGSFRDVSDTATLVRKLNGIGLQASVTMVDLGSKGQWHRVYVGPFASKDDADRVQRLIKARLGINGLVSK